MRTHFAILAAIAITAVAGAAFSAPTAQARKSGGGSGFELNLPSQGMPATGYSGKIGIGRNAVYCDYQRLPTHDCSSGRCKVVGWTLKQHCY